MRRKSLSTAAAPDFAMKGFSNLRSRARKIRRAYADADVFDLAAAYALGIASNHPFVDGNKRVVFVASETFLRLHGVELTASMDERVMVFMRLAAGEIDEAALATRFRKNSKRRKTRSSK